MKHVPMPSKEDLLKAKEQYSTHWKIGRAFNVSGPTVASWFRFYEIEKSIPRYNQRSEMPNISKDALERIMTECKTLASAARKLDVHYSVVQKLCAKHSVTYPTRAEAIRIEKSLEYSKEELEQLLSEHKTREQVANHLNVSSGALKKLFKQYGIRLMTREEGVRVALNVSIPMNESLMEVLDGLVLGDGSIISSGVGTARFTLGTSFREYAESVQTILDRNGLPCAFNHVEDKQTDTHRSSTGWKEIVRSRITKELGAERARWYPNGKKIVPRDLRNSVVMWKWAYVGDGALTNGRMIQFAFCDFTDDDVEFLCQELSKHGFDCWRRKMHDSYNLLIVSTESTPKFLDWIGEPPTEFFRYKWDFRAHKLGVCKRCGTEFQPNNSRQVYCSKKCYMQNYTRKE